jgi:hypothetical protein
MNKEKTDEIYAESGLVEINLEEFDKQLLIYLITFAHKNNFTFNDAIVNILKSYLVQNEQ